jgi:ABC-type nitrate/sulfonate/bicarbonate transport system substrate-binding protein
MTQVYAAVEQGYFRDEGLDVEIMAAGNMVTLLPGLTSGQLQFAVAPIVTLLQGIESGSSSAFWGPEPRSACHRPTSRRS